MKRRSHDSLPLTALGWALKLALLAAVVWCFLGGISNLKQGQNDESRAHLEQSIRRSAVACYAAEGIYPPDLAYLEEHYGLQINYDRYAVFYEVFAENLMPDITVVEVEE